ncbi:hypothetical protein [Mumia zhuanghuii]|uniref:Uncharacterized protein n=1 Tax=Mumia zhuanghuii TaxID=2585211 RepID=A0A5C4LS31_9ACTN|nr:hypothetical protein [Mumia zhuanghuii]TNC21762.1 hypothetical protein FHE65_36265 [Mumia zhuanghuii]
MRVRADVVVVALRPGPGLPAGVHCMLQHRGCVDLREGGGSVPLHKKLKLPLGEMVLSLEWLTPELMETPHYLRGGGPLSAPGKAGTTRVLAHPLARREQSKDLMEWLAELAKGLEVQMVMRGMLCSREFAEHRAMRWALALELREEAFPQKQLDMRHHAPSHAQSVGSMS